MSSDDAKGGRGLLSKVARFVLNPTVDWSELDNRMPGTGTEQDRQAIKAAIERKRRNDFVRQREFDRLRAIMRQRRRSADTPSSPAEGAFFDSTGAGPAPSVEPTIEKIARIEEQMAQTWWSDGQGGPAPPQGVRVGGTVPLRPGEGALTPSDHLQARPAGSGWDIDRPDAAARAVPQDTAARRSAALLEAQTVPADMLPEVAAVGLDSDGRAGPGDEGATMADCTPAIEEAAIRFANGEDQLAEQGLRAATVVETHPAAARLAWLALLDLDRALGRRESFEADASAYAERFGGLPPEWAAAGAAAVMSPVDIAVFTPPTDIAFSTATATAPAARWTCPVMLDSEAVAALRAAVPAQAAAIVIDWSALAAADLPAAQALMALFDEWSARDLDCRFVGAAVLRRRLKASTPSGRRENDPLWWQLRLSALRLMGRFDEFELTALDFCVTYGVLPPSWEAPVCRFESLEQAPEPATPTLGVPLVAEPLQPLVTELAGLEVNEWPAVDTTAAEFEASRPWLDVKAARLEGLVLGDIGVLLGALDAALADVPPGATFVIDCSGLARIDFVAAGNLLQWILERLSRGQRIELAGVSRLVGAFFHVVGLDEAVAVRLREY